MAITINNQPNILHSAGNDNWYAFSSNLDTFEDFNMVVNVKDGNTLLNTLTLPVNPNKLSILNIKNIINDWVQPDFNCFISSPTASTAFRNYTIDVSENFSGLYIQGGSSGGVIGTVSVINNTSISSIAPYTPVGVIKFTSGTVSSNPIYVASYATASNGFINQFTLSTNNTGVTPITASVPLNTFGYLTLINEKTVYTTGSTSSTSRRTAFKSSIDYLDYNESNNYSGYIMGVTGSQFLTRAPKIQQIQPDEVATLTYLNGTQSQPTIAYIVDNQGATYSKSVMSFTQSPIVDIPIGTKNLNINPTATSYCVTLKRPISIATYSTISWSVMDSGGDWTIQDTQDIQFSTSGSFNYSFKIFGDPTLYSTPEDLYTFVVLYSYNEVSNAAFKAAWNIQQVTGTGEMTFMMTSKTTGSNYNLSSYNVVSSAPIVNFYAETSGADVPGLSDASETKCYEISCLNTRWTPFRLTWLNSLGGVDYYTFKFINNSSKRITRNNFDRNLNYGYNKQSRGITTYQLNDFDQYTVVSDPLSDEESEWLTDLLTSQEVYWIDGTTLIPITIIAEQYDRNIGLDNSTLQLTFRLSRTNRK